MDRQARAALRKTVAAARSLVETDIKDQLKRLGIQEDGGVIPAGRLVHITPEQKLTRDRVIQTIVKEKAGHLSPKDAYDRYVRHAGFTFLNRLAALRAMEVRKLLKYETIVRRDEFAGRSEREYRISEQEGISDPIELAQRSFREACEEVSNEIRILFDLTDEYSALFPSPRVLNELYELFSTRIPAEDWAQDDIVGWIYQYYNSEARVEYHRTKKPPKPDDIPVINQFYTSRWIVRALVDNTLGRQWLEMHNRMPKPGIGNPSKGLRTPSGATVDEFCSYLVPLAQPCTRQKKPARDIKVLDPACGSGHFLTYAFDVLYRIYREDEPKTPAEEIPNLILEHNIHGIDIDLRAVQLAALSLYLKAKSYAPKVRISAMNLVCADVRITNGDLQKQFLLSLEPDKELQRIFAKLFQELAYTYHVGSLLKVRQLFQKLLEERAKGIQTYLHPRFSGQTRLSKKGAIEGQTALAISDEKEVLVRPKATLQEMTGILRRFEQKAVAAHDMGSLLFATEAEKSAGLLSLLSQQYDVIVMNPPYGDAPREAKDYLIAEYPRTHQDYYAAFIEQAIDLCLPNGFIGMLTGRTFMFLKWFEKIRTELLYQDSKPELLLDLGSNVLDEAIGLWAAVVLRRTDTLVSAGSDNEAVFFALTPFLDEDERVSAFEEAVDSLLKNGAHEVVYSTTLEKLRKLPRMPYSYWVPESLAELFTKYPPLDRDNAGRPDQPKIADLKVGLETADDQRFVRYWWEVDPDSIALTREETLRGKKWVPFLKGGDAYYSAVRLVVNWANDGQELREFEGSVIRNEDAYFKESLCWSDIASSVMFDFRTRPKGTIFGHAANCLFLNAAQSSSTIIGILNSSLLAFCFLCLDPTLHHRLVGYVCHLPIIPAISRAIRVGPLVEKITELKSTWSAGDETSPEFAKPWLLWVPKKAADMTPSTQHPLAQSLVFRNRVVTHANRTLNRGESILALAQLCQEHEGALRKRESELQTSIDTQVYEAYEVSREDRIIVERELKTLRGFPKALKKSFADAIKPSISIEEHIHRLLSFYILRSMERDTDGIVMLSDLVKGIKKSITDDFGGDLADRHEIEVQEILHKSLEDWLASDFSASHVGLYLRRPIIWQLTSANFGTQKTAKGLFNCFIYYHKLQKDTLHKIRTKYLKAQLDALRWREERLRREAAEGAAASKSELVKVQDSLEELEAFDEALRLLAAPREQPAKLGAEASWVERKVSEIRENGWNAVRDYGVLVNIRPLLEANVLHETFRRVK